MKPLQAVPEEYEVWRNAALGTVVLKKFSELGVLIEVRVNGGGKVQLTPHERRINEEATAHPSLDVFLNGMLTPVKLIDSDVDTATLQANPEAMSETGMKALFHSQIKTFGTRVGEISNVITLRRLLEVAEEVDASLRQVKVINDRIAEVTPQIGESNITGGSYHR